MGADVPSATDDHAIFDDERTTELVRKNVVGFYALSEPMQLCTGAA
jgi:hypothetical protein